MGFVPLKAFAPSLDLGRVGLLKVDLPLPVSLLTLPSAQVEIMCHQVPYSEDQSPFPVWVYLWESVAKPLFQLLWLYTNDPKMTGTNPPFVTLTDTVNRGFGQGMAGKVRSLNTSGS